MHVKTRFHNFYITNEEKLEILILCFIFPCLSLTRFNFLTLQFESSFAQKPNMFNKYWTAVPSAQDAIDVSTAPLQICFTT